MILWGVGLEIGLLLAFDYTLWGNLLLGAAPVPGTLWLFILPFAVGMLVLEELRKWIVRGSLRHRANAR